MPAAAAESPRTDIRLRTLGSVAAWFIATLLAGGVVAGCIHRLVAPLVDTNIVRLTSRCLLIAAFALAPLALRLSGVRWREALGLPQSSRPFLRNMALGLVFGAASFAPHAGLLLATGTRVVAASPAQVVADSFAALLPALATGLVVAVIEETLFRGVVFAALRPGGPACAITVSALLYAVGHFLRPDTAYAMANAVPWYSGFSVIGLGLARFRDPAPMAGDFLALFAAGIALGLIRERNGHIAAGLGVHAAWVMGIRLTREVSQRATTGSATWLAGSFDGVIGYLAASWMLLVTLALAVRGHWAVPGRIRAGR